MINIYNRDLIKKFCVIIVYLAQRFKVMGIQRYDQIIFKPPWVGSNVVVREKTVLGRNNKIQRIIFYGIFDLVNFSVSNIKGDNEFTQVIKWILNFYVAR